MIKMEISLNTDQIEREGKYSSAEIQGQIDSLMQRLHTKKAGNGVFVGTGSKNDYANFGSAILILKKQPWFWPYIDKWMWDVDGRMNDVAQHYRENP